MSLVEKFAHAAAWLAVSCGTFTGSALAITGSPQSRATPATTTVHRRTIWILTKIPASRLLMGQDGHMSHFTQMPNNGTIIASSQRLAARRKSVRASRQETFPGLGSETVSNSRRNPDKKAVAGRPGGSEVANW